MRRAQLHRGGSGFGRPLDQRHVELARLPADGLFQRGGVGPLQHAGDRQHRELPFLRERGKRREPQHRNPSHVRTLLEGRRRSKKRSRRAAPRTSSHVALSLTGSRELTQQVYGVSPAARRSALLRACVSCSIRRATCSLSAASSVTFIDLRYQATAARR